MDNLENNEWEAEAYFNKLKDKKLESGFTTPENYFNDLGGDIYAKLSTQNLKNIVTQDGFSVPEHYFEQLGPKILNKISEISVPAPVALPVTKHNTRIVRLWHSKLLKYASAACFILVATFGLYFNRQQNTVKAPVVVASSNNDQLLFDIDEQAIIDQIETNSDVRATTTATNSEIETYILNNYSQNDITSNL